MCPHVRHFRRCAQWVSPIATQSWQLRSSPDAGAGSAAGAASNDSSSTQRAVLEASEPDPAGPDAAADDDFRRKIFMPDIIHRAGAIRVARMGASLLLVAVIAVAVAALCRRYGWSSPLVLVTVGLGIAWIPELPSVALEPELVLFLILPPLLYSAAQESSYQAFRANWRAIGFLAVGLPLVTTLVVGYVAYLVVPNLPLAAALVLGAVVAPPDAVSAQAIGRRLGLPRRMMTLLGGESLLNDATALTAFRIALAAAVGATATVGEGVLTFAVAALGGLVVGLLVGVVVSWVRVWLTDPPMETAIGIIVPFATYYAAEELHGSGVIAVVTAGLYLGHRSVRLGYATRLQDEAVRKSIDTILESFVFLLIGLQLPMLIEGVENESWTQIAIDAAAVLAATILVRIVWVYPATYLPRLLATDPRPRAAAESGVGVRRLLGRYAWRGVTGRRVRHPRLHRDERTVPRPRRDPVPDLRGRGGDVADPGHHPALGHPLPRGERRRARPGPAGVCGRAGPCVPGIRTAPRRLRRGTVRRRSAPAPGGDAAQVDHHAAQCGLGGTRPGSRGSR